MTSAVVCVSPVAGATGKAAVTALVLFKGLTAPWPATWTWHATLSY